jgi:hypothetical protein
MNQLSLNFDGYHTTNNCGVYTDCDSIILNGDKKGYRGVAIAEIHIANTPHGFDWGASLHMSTGGFGYMPNENHLRYREFAKTRIDAINRAAKEIFSKVSANGEFSRDKNAKNVCAWLETVAA